MTTEKDDLSSIISDLLFDVVECGIDEDEHHRAIIKYENENYTLPLIINWREVFDILLANEEFIDMLNDMLEPFREAMEERKLECLSKN